ncbi:hypothetical protein ACIBQ1_22440 [Nonomuraea sp. NPDC050153]|uniref:hypothetical protein n=1 Tax=Nonomuraea sp. NPDC050153 TaxID=3364359 RepID=UPI0037AFA309
MTVFSGSALAATPDTLLEAKVSLWPQAAEQTMEQTVAAWPKDDKKDDNRKVLFVCGDDNQIAGGNVFDNDSEANLIKLEDIHILGGAILGKGDSEDDNRKCSST